MEQQGYKVLHTIGTGVTSTVYKVQKGDRYYAAKKVKLLSSKTVAETTIYSHVSHPFIVNVYAYVQEDEYLYIIMDEGISLNSIFNTITLSEYELKLFLMQMLSVLNYLDSNGIELLDFHMGNIIMYHNVAKLIDFGDSIFNHRKITHNSTTALCRIVINLLTKKNKITTSLQSIIEKLSFSDQCKEVLISMANLEKSSIILLSPLFKDMVIPYPNKIIIPDIVINRESSVFKMIESLKPTHTSVDSSVNVAKLIKRVYQYDSTLLDTNVSIYIKIAYELVDKRPIDRGFTSIDSNMFMKAINYDMAL